MAAAAILDFKNFKFLTVGRVTSDELRHYAKFRRNRSKRSRYYVSFNIMLVWLENGYSRPFLGSFWVTFPPNDVTHRPNPKKDHFWAEPRHLSHKPRKSVARFELGVCARKKRTGQYRTGQEKSHKRVIFHLFVEKPPLKRCTWKFV